MRWCIFTTCKPAFRIAAAAALTTTKFKATAEACDLRIEYDPRIGWSITFRLRR